MKKILTLIMTFAILLGMPFQSYALSMVEIIEQDIQNITISVAQSVLHVTGANGQTMEIYNVAGVLVMSIKIEGNDKRYNLDLHKGCYIVKINKVVRKISIK